MVKLKSLMVLILIKPVIQTNHCWYIFKISSTYKPIISSRFNELLQKSISFNDFAVATVRRNDYRINFWFTTENKVVYRRKNTDLNEKIGHYDYERNKYLFQLWKMIHHTLWLNNIGIMDKTKKKSKKSKKCYQDNRKCCKK